MIDLNLRYKPVIKDRLFYNRFDYSIGFEIDEASCLRQLDHVHIDDFIRRRKQWREISQQRLNHSSSTIITKRWKEITDTTVQNLHDLAEVLLTTFADYKLTVTANYGHVYSNDLELLQTIDDLPFLKRKSYTQAIINRPKNTIKLKESTHTFRSYFKLAKLTIKEKESLVNFFSNQQDHVRLSPALKIWIDQPFNRVQDYFFVDHDSESWITMISLVYPGLIRKTMQIISAK